MTKRDDYVHGVFGRDLPAWHRWGHVLPGLLTQQQVDEYVRWPFIFTTPSKFDNPVSGEIEEAGNFRLIHAAWRDGEVSSLGQATEQYRCVQASDIFRVFDPVVEEMGATYDAAGVLAGGRMFWILAHLRDRFMPAKASEKDTSERYICAFTKNDGTGSCHVFGTHGRVVCRNTLDFYFGRAKRNQITIRHSGDVKAKIEDARKRVKTALVAMEMGERTIESMFDVKLNQEQRSVFVSKVFGIDTSGKTDLSTRAKNILADIATVWEQGRGALAVPEQKGLLVHDFNTVVEYIDHGMTIRNGNDDGRLRSVAFGTGADRKRKALALAASVVDHGPGVLHNITVPDTMPEDLT
jgi:phage/plasmid-like protein (TIGR03299 family)